jgi:hypothetical protein
MVTADPEDRLKVHRRIGPSRADEAAAAGHLLGISNDPGRKPASGLSTPAET